MKVLVEQQEAQREARRRILAGVALCWALAVGFWVSAFALAVWVHTPAAG